MKFAIKKEEFLKGLSRVQSVADRRNTVPILSNVLIESVEGGIAITATDLEIGLRGVYEAVVSEPGGVTLSARKLYEIVRELPEEDVSVESSESNWATIRSGSAVFKFTGLAKEEFPTLPEMEGADFVPVDAAAMRELIKKTIFAAGDNDTRYVLNGLYMILSREDDTLTIQMVGTDGHRLAVLRKKLGAKASVSGSAIVPKKSASELKKLLDESEAEELQMAMSKNHIVFKIGSLYMVTRLIEGNYPNYEQVIPTQNDKAIIVDKAHLVSALRRVSLLSRERTNAVKFSFAGPKAVLSSQNPEMGEAREDVPVDYDGSELEVGFNAKYLLDALSAMDQEKVRMIFKDSLSPCIITQSGGENYQCVVMPMRV
ncbi:MAG TPA: DNA polymerase III subunit beta [Nitrospirota bacterium]|nr:DNA polymerase III subunit beta [Nitrospirota bacterium]